MYFLITRYCDGCCLLFFFNFLIMIISLGLIIIYFFWVFSYFLLFLMLGWFTYHDGCDRVITTLDLDCDKLEFELYVYFSHKYKLSIVEFCGSLSRHSSSIFESLHHLERIFFFICYGAKLISSFTKIIFLIH